MRRGLGILLTICMIAAGCMDSPSEDPFPSDDATIHLQDALVFRGCLEQTGSVPLDQTTAAQFLPEGFSATPYVGDATGSTAEMYAIFFDCPVVIDGVDRPSATLMLALVVQPPSELRDPETPLTMLPLLTYSNDPGVVELLATWGAGPVERADVEVDLPWATTNARWGQAAATGPQGAVSFDTYATGDREAVPGPGAKLRLFGVDGTPLTGAPGNVFTAVDLWYPPGNVFQGTGQFTAEGRLADQLGRLPPASLAVHWWGSTYDIHLEHNQTALTPHD